MSTISAGTTSTTTLIHSGDTTGSLVFKTNDTGSGGTTAVTIDTSQNVGIGTSSPAAPLDVKGVVRFTNSANVANYGEIYDGGGLILKSQNSNPMYFFTSNTERMRIDSSGNLLVGTTSVLATGSPFQVSGPASYATAVIKVGADGNGAFVFRNASNTTSGSIGVNTSSTTYATSSDYRLKESITPMTDALARVAQLKPVTYKWKADGSASQGFIAHELAEVVPECVTGEKDAVDADGKPVYQGIDTSFLVATLTAALQETKALIDQQAETINALTARVVALESK